MLCSCYLTLPRTYGECCCPHKYTSEADPPSAYRPSLTSASCRPARCLSCDATPDAVARAASPACPHGTATPEAEPHHPHPETPGPGPCGDSAGAGVQVRALLPLQVTPNHVIPDTRWCGFHFQRPVGYATRNHPMPFSLGSQLPNWHVSFQKNCVHMQADRYR